jgi:hypothetical protein
VRLELDRRRQQARPPERALRAAADAHVVLLPSRLRVVDVPAGVERRYDDFCARDAEFGEGVEGSS